MNDNMFDALADVHQRQWLLSLLDNECQTVPKLTGVSRQIAGADEKLLRKHLSSSREIAGADEELLRAHHVVLPKLADYGFIKWDREAGVIMRGPRFDDVRPVLEQLDGDREKLLAKQTNEILSMEGNTG